MLESSSAPLEPFGLVTSMPLSSLVSASNQPRICVTKSLLEMHTGELVIDFSHHNYIGKTERFFTYELLIRCVLCLASILLSLIGNLGVIYKMLIKPKVAKQRNKDTSSLISANHQQQQQLVSSSYLNTEVDETKKFVITRIYKQPSRDKPVNLFILNLCICDLMITVCCSWVQLINTVSENWPMGSFFCSFNTYAQVASLTAAISTLAAISVERSKAIVCTMSKKLNRASSIKMIVLIWMFSLTVAIPILMYRKQYKRIWKDHVEIWCSDAWPRTYQLRENTDCVLSLDEPLRRVYYTVVSLVLFFIPIIIMLVCYVLIMRKLGQTKILKLMRADSCERQLLNHRRKKVNILLIGLIVSFVVCWTPAQGFILYEAHKQFSTHQMPAWFDWLHFLVYLLAYSNSAINPIIYSGLNKVYAKELGKIVNIVMGKKSEKDAKSETIPQTQLLSLNSKNSKKNVSRTAKINSFG